MASRRLDDPSERVAGTAVCEERLDGRPEREGEVERPDEEAVDAGVTAIASTSSRAPVV